jgi:Glycosyl transferases group 1
MRSTGMKILLWHVHGSWTTAFVQGVHDYLLPVLPDRGPDGLGRARTWDWPSSVVERTPAQLAADDIDVVVLQRPEEIELTQAWTRRTPGLDLPAVYLEHNAPHPSPVDSRHPLADQSAIPLVHVTHFNRMYWDNGRARTVVIEHGVLDPGPLYTGELPHAAAVINEPMRRGRTVGTDLLPAFADVAPVDLFGMANEAPAGVTAAGDLAQAELHLALARRRLYLHPIRWTSLGLSLIEAMMLGMPVVAVAATEARRAVPADGGVVSADLDELRTGVRTFVADPEAAALAGKAARAAALERYGVERFLTDWDRVLREVSA